jgi:GNAT superfamily N-acetyltransferase
MAFVMTRRAIDDATFNISTHAFGPPWQCSKCGATERCRTFSRQAQRGRMYVSFRGTAGFDVAEVLLLCENCWPRWLMWRAREGYDLHLHGPATACDPACLARKGGRRAQLISQLSVFEGLDDQFFLVKEYDGLPNRNGTFLLNAERLRYFAHRNAYKQAYYESTSDVDELVRQIPAIAQLEAIGLERSKQDQHLVVFEAFQSAYSAPSGAIPMPKPGDPSIGLHSVPIVGYRESGRELLFRNSWGRAWGDRGYGSISTAYLHRYMNETMTVRRAVFGPTPWTFHNVPLGSLTDRQLRDRLRIVNPTVVWRRRVAAGESWRFEGYQTISPSTNAVVECLNVQYGYGLRLGWIFLRYRWEGTCVVVELPELFVWPVFRRMGVGRTLEEFATARARANGALEIHLLLNEADAVVGPHRSAARHFATALGYEWRWRNGVAPRSTGAAIKRICV